MKTFAHPDQAGHAPTFFLQRGQVRRHFEVPARAAALEAALHRMGLAPAVPPPLAPRALESVHAPDYLAFLASAAQDWAALPGAAPEAVPNIHPTPEMLAQGGFPGAHIIGRVGWYTADTACPIGPGTWEAVQGAAACALAAAAEAANGGTAYALCRPPGHHAYADLAGGFCYLNNVAVAANYLARTMGRAAIIDIDVHHGNGTQGIFYARPDVMTVSIHADPVRFYPFFWGFADERGEGPGLGYNLNLPLPRKSGDAPFLEALTVALRRVRAFAPEAIVVALGLDAHEGDPFGGLSVTTPGFARIGEALAGLGLPTVIVQEGGYLNDALSANLTSFLAGFGGAQQS